MASTTPEDDSNPQEEPGEEGASESTDPSRAGRNKKLAAFGIGSAAIVAALLFAGRNREKDGD